MFAGQAMCPEFLGLSANARDGGWGKLTEDVRDSTQHCRVLCAENAGLPLQNDLARSNNIEDRVTQCRLE